MTSLFNWLIKPESWRHLEQEDIETVKEQSQYWKEQRTRAETYITHKGQAIEDEAIARAVFNFLPVAKARAKAIKAESEGIARIEAQQALPSAKKRIKDYAQRLREGRHD